MVCEWLTELLGRTIVISTHKCIDWGVLHLTCRRFFCFTSPGRSALFSPRCFTCLASWFLILLVLGLPWIAHSLEIIICIYSVRGDIDQMSTNSSSHTICSAPNVFLTKFMALVIIFPLTHSFICRKKLFVADFLHSIMNDNITVRVDKVCSRNIATRFSRFQHEKKFWDWKIIGGSETLYCHSYIVSSISPVMEEIIGTVLMSLIFLFYFPSLSVMDKDK